jgi:hypothetical protein
MAGSGLPTAVGVTPVVPATTPTSEPLPGSGPRTDGTVESRLVATYQAPPRTATVASASCRQPTFGP